MSIHHRTCSLCDAQCRLRIEHDGEAVTRISGARDDPFSGGHICPKAVALQDLHTDPDRLRMPMRRTSGGFVEIGWDVALQELTERFARIRRDHGKDALGIYIGNPNVHHYGNIFGLAVLLDLLDTRARFSAQSVDNLPHVFAAHAMFGHALMIGVPDVDRTHHLLILGANPWVANGGGLSSGDVRSRIEGVKDRGRVVVVDPRRTETADAVADAHHFIRPGTDALLLLAMMQVIFDEDRVAPGPWQAWCDGLEELRELSSSFRPERVAAHVGIDAETIREMVRAFCEAESATLYARIGICTQEFGGLAAWLVVALHAITGNLDRPGGLMFPRPAVDTAAITAWAGEAGHVEPEATRGRGLPAFAGELPVAAMADEIETTGPSQIRGLITLAGNPALSAPDSARMERALGSLDTHVAIGLYLDETARLADIVLPASSPLQRDHYPLGLASISVRNVASYSEPLFAPDGGRDDWDILTDIAHRLCRAEGRHGRRMFIASARALGPRRVLDTLLRAGPYGLGRGGLSLSRLRSSELTVDLGPLQPCLPERCWTPSGRVQLAPARHVADVARLRAVLDRPPPDLVLIGRRQLRSNNSWMHNSARLVRGKPRCTLQIHPEDAATRGLAHGDRATLSSEVGEVGVEVETSDRMCPGVVSLPHGWGHDKGDSRLSVASAHPGSNINQVTDTRFVDRLTGTIAFNGVPVTLR